jgi:hypothetical protein
MIPKSGNLFLDRIMLKQKHDPKKWTPDFGQDHAEGRSMIDHAQTNIMIPKRGSRSRRGQIVWL